MQVVVTGKQLSVGDSLRAHVDTHLADQVAKYFEHAIEASVVFSREGKGRQIRSDISVHIGRNIQMQGHGEADDAYIAFDAALDRIAKRLRRYKRRLRDHRKTAAAEQTAILQAQQYVLAAGDEDQEEHIAEGDQPVIVAEMTTPVDTLTVGEAVMRMDLANADALVFQNRAHGGLNVVYKRSDGNIGWIDPQGNPPARPRN
jgi:ribosomal subunit interface protein